MNEMDFENLNEVIEEIKSYTVGGENLTFSTLFALIGNETVINKGICGAGKSRSSKDLVENVLDVSGVVTESGYMTPKGFFNLIKANSGKVIILDESDILLDNRQITQMMKSLLTSWEVVWATDKDKDPIEFKGSFILNCNDYDFGRGIEDKALTNQTALSTKEFKNKIKAGREYEPDMEVWDKISRRIEYAREHNLSISQETKDRVYDFILGLPSITSYRVKNRTLKVFNSLNSLLGIIENDTMTDELFELGMGLSRKFMPDSRLNKILANEDEEIKRKELAEKIANADNVSERTAYRKINSLIREGYLQETENERYVKKPNIENDEDENGGDN